MRFRKPVSVLLVLAGAAGLFWMAYAYFETQVRDQAKAGLSLHRSTVQAELRHFAHFPFVLSLDPYVVAALDSGNPEALNHRLARFAQSAGVEAIFLMDQTGLTISSSNARTANSFVGNNYAFRPYFQNAMKGELAQFYGIGATSGAPGYFYAMRVQSDRSGRYGVIAVKVDLGKLQDSWQAAGMRILLTNADGVVLLASNPDWRYRTLYPLNGEQRDRIFDTQQFGNEPLTPLDWQLSMARNSAVIGGERLLYLQTGDLPNSWALHVFVKDDVARTQAWLMTGVLLFMAGLAFVALQVRRVRRINRALLKSEQEEMLLRSANERLAAEIEERRAAQDRLQKTQAELERAGRLAALGQLASSVTHELGQPIAAMRNQLAAAEMTAGQSPLGDKMQALVSRMEDITRQLKFFSRKGRDRFEPVDLVAAMTGALDLLEPSILQADAEVVFTKPAVPVIVRGNRLRIEQVMTNIVRNALDAVEGAKIRHIAIEMGSTDTHAWLSVADRGHGLGGRSMEDLKEPFATTRESGRGMGLGLTISAGIVADHGGDISACDRVGGGAVFRVSLPRNHEGPIA